MEKGRRGILLVVLATAAFSVMAIFGKIAYDHGGRIIPILAFRFLIGGSVLWLLWKLKGDKAKKAMAPKDRRTLWIMGTLGYAGTTGSFFAGLQFIPASLAALLFYTYPVWLTLYGVILDKKDLKFLEGLALGASVAGVALTVGLSLDGLHPLGVGLALASGFIHATYQHFAQPLTKRVPPLLLVCHLSTAAALVFLTIGLTTGTLILQMAWQVWGAILVMALLSTVIGLRLLWAGIRRLGAAKAALISTMEPMLTAIWATLLLGESWGLRQALGGALILLGVWGIPAYGAWMERHHRREGPNLA